jgi:hypothetical protein
VAISVQPTSRIVGNRRANAIQWSTARARGRLTETLPRTVSALRASPSLPSFESSSVNGMRRCTQQRKARQVKRQTIDPQLVSTNAVRCACHLPRAALPRSPASERQWLLRLKTLPESWPRKKLLRKAASGLLRRQQSRNVAPPAG